MKKGLLLFVMLIGVVVLSGCAEGINETVIENAVNEGKVRFTIQDSHLKVTKDKETGCKYIMINGSGITPLMLADGTQDCSEEK